MKEGKAAEIELVEPKCSYTIAKTYAFTLPSHLFPRLDQGRTDEAWATYLGGRKVFGYDAYLTPINHGNTDHDPEIPKAVLDK